MTGFQPGPLRIGSNISANCATIIALPTSLSTAVIFLFTAHLTTRAGQAEFTAKKLCSASP